MHDPACRRILHSLVFSGRRLRTGISIASCAILVLLGSRLHAQTSPGLLQVPDDGPPDPAYVQVPEDPSLPRVLIIGDSISMGYTWEVDAHLFLKRAVVLATRFGRASEWAETIARTL